MKAVLYIRPDFNDDRRGTQLTTIQTIRRTLTLIAACACASGAVHAADVHVGVNIGMPAPVYVAPPPVYAPPPPPVIYQPAPVYVRPPVVIGWHGNRYYDGRRYWDRDDWYRHHGRGNYQHRGNGHGYGHGNNHGHGGGHRH